MIARKAVHVRIHILLSRVKPEVNSIQLHVAVEDGSTFVEGWLQLTTKDGSVHVRGLPQSTR